MAKFTIRFAQWTEYEIEADSVDKAIEQAEEEYDYDMSSSIASPVWDEVIVENEQGEEIEHGYS